ncbi:MAG: tripartite tricarboxylate transporter substrate binding protein [Thermodesulfobacteriota bacterium]
MIKKFAIGLTIGLCLFWQFSSVGAAEKYPTKPVTFLVPFGAGGMTDVTARLLAEKFKAILGQPFLVLNKPGASGTIGVRYALAQKADGYTVIVAAMTEVFAAPYFLGGEFFDFKDFSFVGGYMPQQRVLFAPADAPYKSFSEFIQYAQKNPGQISVGSGASQWALEVVKSIAVKHGLKMKYVMFKSGGEASTALLGRHVNVCETGTGTPAFQAAREGKLIPLVNLGAGKVPYFPEVKNLEELGYPFWSIVEYGLSLRSGASEEIRKKLENTLQEVLADKEIKEKLFQMGLTPRFLNGKEYSETVQKVIRSVPQLVEYSKKAIEG